MKSRLVSLTGATGFVGWHLAEAFRDAGWQVRAIVRPSSRNPVPSGVTRIDATLAQDPFTRAVAGSDVVVHAAGLTRARNGGAFARANVETARAAAIAANAAGARVILISSQAAAGPGTAANPATEDDPVRPLTEYGRSKLDGEAALRGSARTPWVVLRPSAIYGPRDRQFLPLFQMASRGLFLLAAPAATAFTFIHVHDVARAVLKASTASAAVGQTLFLGHGTPHTTDDLLRTLAAILSTRYRPIPVPAALLGAVAVAGEAWRWLGGDPLLDRARWTELVAGGFVCRVDRARVALDFNASIGLREGLEQTAAWYLENGWLRGRSGIRPPRR
jgi:nucleoside-diphosphate-sugar epimerase